MIETLTNEEISLERPIEIIVCNDCKKRLAKQNFKAIIRSPSRDGSRMERQEFETEQNQLKKDLQKELKKR